MINTLSADQIKKAEQTLNTGTWIITAGAILYSVLTVTPLVERVTPDDWDKTAFILPLVVDAAVVIVVRLESVLSRLGVKGGFWPAALRWMTGSMTLGLNTADSWLKGDKVGVAVHAVAPLLLIVTAEAARGYRQAITKALAERAHEQAAEAERHRVHEQRERERERAEREAREQREREEREREQDRLERAERERRDHEARLAQEQRDHEAALRREAADREDRRLREQREAEDRRLEREREELAEQRRREEAEAERNREEADRRRREREERRRVHEQPQRPAREQSDATPAAPAKPTVNAEKMPEADARQVVMNTPGASVRQLAETTGWSVGWVQGVRRELEATAT